MNTMASARSSAGLARWASLGGILYVVLFVIGVIVMFDGEPDGDASPAKVIAYYSKASHRDKISIGWIIAGLGIFAFLWFLSSLRRAVRRWEGEDGFLTAQEARYFADRRQGRSPARDLARTGSRSDIQIDFTVEQQNSAGRGPSARRRNSSATPQPTSASGRIRPNCVG